MNRKLLILLSLPFFAINIAAFGQEQSPNSMPPMETPSNQMGPQSNQMGPQSNQMGPQSNQMGPQSNQTEPQAQWPDTGDQPQTIVDTGGSLSVSPTSQGAASAPTGSASLGTELPQKANPAPTVVQAPPPQPATNDSTVVKPPTKP